MFPKWLVSSIVVTLAVGGAHIATAVPISVTGYPIVKFTDIQTPILISIDSDGVVYAGNNPPGGGCCEPARVRRVAADGSSVTEIGDLLSDPDPVIVDLVGHVVAPGNLIAGGNASLNEIDLLTGATTVLFSGSPLGNVHEMAFDSQGRLFVAQVFDDLLVIDQGSVSVFASFPGHDPLAMAIDESDQLFVGLRDDSTIQKVDLGGLLPTQQLATVPGTLLTVGYAPEGFFAGSLFVGTHEGEIYEVDPSSGTVDLFATGFGQVHDIQFNSNGVMYISDFDGNAIWTIAVPEPSSIFLATIGLFALVLYGWRHRKPVRR